MKASGVNKASQKLGGVILVRDIVPGSCPECAVKHQPEQPHNQQSLFWQYHFRELNGRWPTWKDAMAHCAPAVQAIWTEELGKLGVKVEPGKMNRSKRRERR